MWSAGLAMAASGPGVWQWTALFMPGDTVTKLDSRKIYIVKIGKMKIDILQIVTANERFIKKLI